MSRRSAKVRSRPRPVVLREVRAARPNPRADAIALAALVALQVAFWWRALLLRGFLLSSDICYQFEPFKSYLHEALRAGRLALWTPYLYAGYPIGAEGQIATFSPPSLLFSWLFSGGGAVNWLLFFHLVVAGVSLHLLARTLGISPFGAWAGATTFSFAGYFFAHLHHVGIIGTAAWLPLVILFVERAWRGNPLPNAALAALVWALAALAGSPQTLFHISLVVLFWIAWRALRARRGDAKARPVRKAITILAITYLLGVGLSAVQLLLTKDLSATAPHGERGSLGYVTSYSLLPEHLFGLLLPNWEGSPAFANYLGAAYYWEYVLYLGLLPLLLALIGAVTRRGWVFAGLAAGALVLALAEGNPIYEVLRHVPGFADFRASARFIYVFTFAAALLVGVGWDAMAGERGMPRGRRLYLVAGLAALLTIADLWRFDRTLAHLTSPAAYRAPQPVVAAMSKRSWGRLLVIPPVSFTANWTPGGGWARRPDGWAEPRQLLAADAPQSYDLQSIYGYVGFEDPTYRDFFMAMGPQLYAGKLELASLLGVRDIYVTDGSVSFPALAHREVTGLTYVTQARPVLYRNPGAFPQVFTVGEVVPVQSASEAQAAVLALADRGALGATAVTVGELGGFRPRPNAVVRWEVRAPRPEHIIVRAASDRDALLVLNERWDQGWQVRRDDRPAPLVRADAVLMGTPLPKGEHTIEFIYRPRGLVVGRAVTLVSLVVWVGLVAVPLVRARRSRP